MTEQDKKFIESSLKSGELYGFPKCCIDEFISNTPSVLKNKKCGKDEILKFDMGHLGGTFTGFIPCLKHARQIKKGEIKLTDLIDNKKRKVTYPFPLDWSLK